MKVIIDIPNHEFDNDVKDKFQDYFRRVGIDICHGTMCGNYERETTDMFLASFKRLQVIPGNATNGDTLKIVFPNIEWEEMHDLKGDKSIGCTNEFWNAPYKGVEE